MQWRPEGGTRRRKTGGEREREEKECMRNMEKEDAKGRG